MKKTMEHMFPRMKNQTLSQGMNEKASDTIDPLYVYP